MCIKNIGKFYHKINGFSSIGLSTWICFTKIESTKLEDEAIRDKISLKEIASIPVKNIILQSDKKKNQPKITHSRELVKQDKCYKFNPIS